MKFNVAVDLKLNTEVEAINETLAVKHIYDTIDAGSGLTIVDVNAEKALEYIECERCGENTFNIFKDSEGNIELLCVACCCVNKEPI